MISIREDWMLVNVTKSKTDQLRQGNELVIVRTHTKLCPVATLKAYMKKGELCPGSKGKLFR